MCACAMQPKTVVGQTGDQSQHCLHHMTLFLVATININRELSKSPFVWQRSFLSHKTREMTAKKAKIAMKEEGRHSEETFQYVLAEGEEDFDDFSTKELEMFPELGFEEEEVENVMKELSPSLRQKYRELRSFHLHQYRTSGRIQAFSDVVRECMSARYPGIPGSGSNEVLQARDSLYHEFKRRRAAGNNPEATESEVDLTVVEQEITDETQIKTLTPFVGKTIADVIDLTNEGGDEVVIRIKKNTTLHDALTPEQHEYTQVFGEEQADEEAVSEHSLDDGDEFMTKEAIKLLRDLSLHDARGAELKGKAADLIEGGTLPPEASEEIYTEAIRSGTKSTPVSKSLYDECDSIAEFHLVLALGWRTFKEAAAARDTEAGKAPRPVPMFLKLSEEFQIACGTLSRQYNEAVWYSMLRKKDGPKKEGKNGKK